jgi:hypothetical protein
MSNDDSLALVAPKRTHRCFSHKIFLAPQLQKSCWTNKPAGTRRTINTHLCMDRVKSHEAKPYIKASLNGLHIGPHPPKNIGNLKFVLCV